MQTGPARRLTIYLSESDRADARPLYMAVLAALHAAGVAGATATRGVAGFGAHSRIKTASLVDLSADLPVVIQVVDEPERITAALDAVYPLVNEGLITVEDLTVVKYGHRYTGAVPRGRPVREFMSTTLATVDPDTPLSEVVHLLVTRNVKAVPVVDSDTRVLGIITGGDLLARGGLPIRLSLQRDSPLTSPPTSFTPSTPAPKSPATS